MKSYPPDTFAALDLLRQHAANSLAYAGDVSECEEALRILRTVLEKERIVRRAFKEMVTGGKSRRPMPPAFVGDSSAPTIAVNAIIECWAVTRVWGKVSIDDPIVDRSADAVRRKAHAQKRGKAPRSTPVGRKARGGRAKPARKAGRKATATGDP